MSVETFTPARAQREIARSRALRRLVEPATRGRTADEWRRTREIIECVRAGKTVRCGKNVRCGSGVKYPWLGNANVAAAFLATAPYIFLAGADVNIWTAQQAYTVAGAPTTYTLTQANTAIDPLWNSTGLDGKPCVEFDGVAEYLSTTGANFLGLVTGNDTPLCFILWWQVVALTNPVFFDFRNTGDNFNNVRIRGTSGKFRATKVDAVGTTGTADTTTSISTAQRVLVERRLATTVVRRIDGVADAGDPRALNVGNVTAPGAFRLGVDIAGAQFANIRVGGFWIVLSDDTVAIDAIENWALSQ